MFLSYMFVEFVNWPVTVDFGREHVFPGEALVKSE